MKSRPNISDLEKKLGYFFSDPSLLNLALTHKSFSSKNNERLEFLGDAVLGYVIAADLYRSHEELQEDALSLMRVALVRGDVLAEIALDCNLPDYLLLGPGELKSGGRTRPSILADALEAIIGAVHEDGGIEDCRNLIKNIFGSRLVDLELENLKDPKTRLQEILQGNNEELPVYEVESVTGQDHDLSFKVKCSLPSLNIAEFGEGTSRRLSEKIAAQRIIEELEALGLG